MKSRRWSLYVLGCGLVVVACGSTTDAETGGSGGAGVSPATGGDAAGGSSAGGNGSGGIVGSGGLATDSGGSGANVGGAGGIGAGGSGVGGSDVGGAGGGVTGDLFEISVHLASEEDPNAPTTVGIVEWSTTVGAPTAATLQFGLTTAYGMEAPVDVTAPELRGVLLGMKPGQTYHFRVLATVGGEEFSSEDRTVVTGAAPDTELVSILEYEVLSADEREPGFIIASYWEGPQKGSVFVLDEEGEIVWWYRPEMSEGVAKAAISADGQDMWMVSSANTSGEPLVRVGMDGLDPTRYAGTIGSHDILPRGGDVMAFIEYSGTVVREIDRAGQLTTLLNLADLPVSSSSLMEHPNALAYNSESDTFALSSLFLDVYFFPRVGATSGNIDTLTSVVGPNLGWGERQHSVQWLADNHFLLFANAGAEEGTASAAIEYNLDDGEEVWRYESGHETSQFGGAQRLPGGNTLVTYSNEGVIHEVTSDGQLVLQITTNEMLAYATWVPSLYPREED